MKITLNKKEAFLLLYLLESFLPEAEPEDEALLEALLEKLQGLSPTSPYRSATEARRALLGAF